MQIQQLTLSTIVLNIVIMNIKKYRAEESLGFMTITTYRVMHAAFRRQFKAQDIDLTPEQWGILLLLWEKRRATQAELANLLCVDKSSISRVLALMEDKGWLYRRIDPENERRKIITATEASFELQEPAYVITNQIIEDALKGTTPEESETCMKVLFTIRNNLQKLYE